MGLPTTDVVVYPGLSHKGPGRGKRNTIPVLVHRARRPPCDAWELFNVPEETRELRPALLNV